MWQRALRYLGGVGWDVEDIERACEVLAPAFEDEDSADFVRPELASVREKLGAQVSQRQADALLELARLHEQVGGDAEGLRSALLDFERFVNDDG